MIKSPVAADCNINVIIERIVREVAELPDRTSPVDQPDMMLVTAKELSAIIRANVFVVPIPDPPRQQNTFQFADGWTIDVIRRRAIKGGTMEMVRLNPNVLRLIQFLATRPNQVIPRKDVAQHLGPCWSDPRNADVHIKRLRTVLDLHPSTILTHRGVGWEYIP